MIELDSKYDRF